MKKHRKCVVQLLSVVCAIQGCVEPATKESLRRHEPPGQPETGSECVAEDYGDVVLRWAAPAGPLANLPIELRLNDDWDDVALTVEVAVSGPTVGTRVFGVEARTSNEVRIPVEEIVVGSRDGELLTVSAVATGETAAGRHIKSENPIQTSLVRVSASMARIAESRLEVLNAEGRGPPADVRGDDWDTAAKVQLLPEPLTVSNEGIGGNVHLE